MVRLIITYYDDSKEEHEYRTKEEAKRIADGYRMAFGNQIKHISIV